MDTFPWFCACRSDDLGAGSGEQGGKGTKSAEQRPIGGCYCCHQSEGFSVPEVPDPLGLKGRPFLLLRWPGAGGARGGGAEVGASACVRAVFVAACVRAGPFPGWVAPAHSLHFSRSVSVTGRLEARAVRRRLGVTVLVPERPGSLRGRGRVGGHPVANRVADSETPCG